jgi:hypothetical protein
LEQHQRECCGFHLMTVGARYGAATMRTGAETRSASGSNGGHVPMNVAQLDAR